MVKFVCFFAWIMLSSAFSLAQSSKYIPILERFTHASNGTKLYTSAPVNFFNIQDLPENIIHNGQKIIKNAEGRIFLQQDGTGRLYEYMNQRKSGTKWTRIDSTYFTGYNFGSLFFSIDTILYSFGGAGFWMENGHLRYYNAYGKEWNGIHLSDALHWANQDFSNFFHVDYKKKELYILQNKYSHDALIIGRENRSPGLELYRLSIEKGKWEKLGKVLTENNMYSILTETPWGALLHNLNIVNPITNEILTFKTGKKKELEKKLYRSKITNQKLICFFDDSTLFIGNDRQWMDSISIRNQDIVVTDEKFYNIAFPEVLNHSQIYVGILLFLLGGLCGLAIGKKRNQPIVPSLLGKEQTIPVSQVDRTIPEPSKSGFFDDVFNQREKSLISIFLKNQLSDRLTSIQDINRTIGVMNRTADIQKKMRSDIIIAINQKFSSLSASKQPLILKKRSEFDKRTFEYMINTIHLEFLNKNMT